MPRTPLTGAVASKLLEEGRPNLEVLVKYGLSATLLDELENDIKEFDSSLRDSDCSKQTDVAPRAEIEPLGDEIVRIVGIVDGFSRDRFHHDPGLIAAWASASHRFSGPHAKAEEPAATPPATGLEPAA